MTVNHTIKSPSAATELFCPPQLIAGEDPVAYAAHVRIDKAEAGRDVNAVTQVHVAPHKSEAFDEVIRNFLVPSSNFLGEFFAEFLRSKLTEKEKDNIYSHVSSVKERIVSPTPREGTSKKFAKFGEWAAGASDADSDKQPDESAVWRVALDEIILQSDYRMLNIVNNLQADEIMSISVMLENNIYDGNLGDRLKSFGIARRELIEAPNLRRAHRVSFFLIAATSLFFILSELEPLLRPYIDTSSFQRAVQISKWATLFIWILYTIYSIYVNFDRLHSYRLTEYGIRIANKIRIYTTAAPAAGAAQASTGNGPGRHKPTSISVPRPSSTAPSSATSL